MGVTVTFVAILELMREGLIDIVQTEPYAPLHVRATPAQPHLRVVSIDADAAAPAAVLQAPTPALPSEDEDPA